VIWNIAMIAALVAAGAGLLGVGTQSSVAIVAGWGTVVGAALQLSIQMPAARRLNRGLRLAWNIRRGPVRQVLRTFGPVVVARGGVQISGYIDQYLSSFLGPETVAAIAYATLLSVLPVSLFGMSISAAELPEMSGALGTAAEIAAALRARLTVGLKRISFFLVPSVTAFLVLGDVVSSTVFQTGHFRADDAATVWVLLIGSSFGLLATAQARICVSAFYALQDTKTPTRYALLRLGLTGVFGFLVVFGLRGPMGWNVTTTAAILLTSNGVAGWLEFLLIKRALVQRVGALKTGGAYLWRSWAAALLAGVGARGLKLVLPAAPPWLAGGLVLAAFMGLYLGCSLLAGSEEARAVVSKILRRVRRS
jgi:putative peptidoglycan lipid II flippase